MSKKRSVEVLGYGYRLSSENLKRTLRDVYNIELDIASLDGAKASYVEDKGHKLIGPTSKPKYFRIVVEEIES